MQEANDTQESKFRKVDSDAYSRKRLNINNISNTSQWSADQWEEFEDMYNDD